LEGWSDCLRLELKAFNVNIVIVEPGLIQTEFADVLTAPMVKYSGKGAYTNLVNAIAKSTGNTKMSPASVIAKTISKIVNSNKPKTRYRVGKWAKPMVWMRINLGDRLFDRLIMSQIK